MISRIDFALNYYIRSNPLKTVEEKKKLVQEFIPILARLTSQLELDSYLRKLQKITEFEADSIRNLVSQYRLNENNPQVIRKQLSDFHPERKALQKLATAERELLYQMMGNVAAIAFYEKNVGAFYDDIYREIANYIIEYNEKYQNIDINGVMLLIESNDSESKEAVLKDLTEILEEDFHPTECTEDLLDNLLDTINSEKLRISEEDALEESLKGKTELEQARIIAEFNRRKALKNKK